MAVISDVFQLVSDSRGLLDHNHLTLLLRNCIQIPKQLGEVAAFGGSNVEPSVQSCLEKVHIESSAGIVWNVDYCSDDPVVWVFVSLSVSHAGDCSYSFTRWRQFDAAITTLL